MNAPYKKTLVVNNKNVTEVKGWLQIIYKRSKILICNRLRNGVLAG